MLVSNPKADIRGFVVWFPMYRGDAKDRWHAELLSDRRLLHRWDQPKAIGRFFLTHRDLIRPEHASGTWPKDADALWDAWLLFGPTAKWTGTMPDGLISWGATVVRTNQRLLEDFRTVVNATPSALESRVEPFKMYPRARLERGKDQRGRLDQR